MIPAEPASEIRPAQAPLELVRDTAELEAFLEDVLRVCSPGPMLVVGSGAPRVVRAVLNRGVDAYGLETNSAGVTPADALRSQAARSLQIPFDNAQFESALVLGALDPLEPDDLGVVLGELARTVRGSVILVSLRLGVAATSVKSAGQLREWWEKKFIPAGFRKHPLRSWFNPYETLDVDHSELVLAFERTADTVQPADEIYDAAIVPGPLADALLTRYEVAATYIRPWDVALDLGCDSGYGLHVMRRASRGGRFIGIDNDASSIQYAGRAYAAKIAEFRHAAPLEALRQMPDNSVHFIFCSDDRLESSLQNPAVLAELLRVLVPGGRALLSLAGPLSENGHKLLLTGAPEEFLVEKIYQLNMRRDGDGAGNQPAKGRALRAIPSSEAAEIEADWRLVLLMKDPVRAAVPSYEETVFGNLNGCQHPSIAYKDYYRNPYILHALMHASFRVTSSQIQAEAAARILAAEAPQSPDAGAALCLLLYRLGDASLPVGLTQECVLRKVNEYFNIAAPNPMQRRWQISLSSALGLFHLRRGDFPLARAAFETCLRFDPFVHLALAAKPVESCFWLGWMALGDGDLDRAEEMWTRGLQLGDQIVGRGLVETLMQPSWPNLFDWGDGMRELTATLESVTQCANGLHCLRLQRQGVSFRWDLIPNTFRAQRDNRERLLRQAQSRVARLCRDIDSLNSQLREREAEIAALREQKNPPPPAPVTVLAPSIFNQTCLEPQKAHA